MALRPHDARVRAAINAVFVEAGGPPSADELHARTELPRDEIFESLRRLEAQGSITLRPGTLDVWTAPPFSATPTLHRVSFGAHHWWAGCAWCALGVCAMVGAGIVHSPYAGEGADVALDVGPEGPHGAPREAVTHFAVPAMRWAESLGYACSTILFFASEDDVEDWCARHRLPSGAVIPLEQTWRLAHAWFARGLDAATHMRHRSDLDAVMRSVGLDDPFFLLK